MTGLIDPEFGPIQVQRRRGVAGIRIQVQGTGQLRATVPPLTPLWAVRGLIELRRGAVRRLWATHRPTKPYQDGDTIGHQHYLVRRVGPGVSVHRQGHQIIVTAPTDLAITDPRLQVQISQVVATALRQEARAYLPKRLARLAAQHRLQYQRLRLSHAKSRWGSYSSRGTVSLNIALMTLPLELIDYVLCHELAHSQHMDHSPAFWRLVARLDPDYRIHRQALRKHTPYI